MKASELMWKLQVLIEKYGDLEVMSAIEDGYISEVEVEEYERLNSNFLLR